MNINRIFRHPVIKKIVWTPTTVCNYSCSYCPSWSHDGKYRWPKEYKNLIKFINTWRNDSELTIDILGGEPTLWPDFHIFCDDIIKSSSHFTKIIFSSNGSRSLRYWEEFSAPVTNIGLSFHPEFADIDHFINVVNVLHNRYPLTIYLMLVYPHLECIKSIYEKLKDYNVNVTIMSVVNKTTNDHSGIISKFQEYDDFAKTTFTNKSILPEKMLYYRTYVSDGIDEIPIKVQNFINEGKDKFKGWDCFMGRDTLNIHPNGDIYGSSCSSGPCYGNINNLDLINISNSPFVCPHEYCGCGTDVEIEKRLKPTS